MDIIPDELALPQRTICGAGTIDRLPEECAIFGRRGVLVHGQSLQRSGILGRIIETCGDDLSVRTWMHPGGEPTLANVEALIKAATEHDAEWIAAVGGGSAMDAAKAAAGLMHAPLPPVAYHDGAAIPVSKTAFIAAPATAGTGSEATTVSVLTNPDTGVKKSIRHASHMAKRVILDPMLLRGCPKQVIASSGMDALTQAVEAHVSNKSTWLSEGLSLKGAELIASSLEAVYNGAQGDEARDLLQGSYLAGLSLAMARLGLVHGLAHPLGSRYHVPHGLTCAVCLPHVLEFNAEAMDAKYEGLCRAVGGELRERVGDLMTAMQIVSPFKGHSLTDLDAIIEETLASGSTAANPRPVTAEDVKAMVTALFS